MRWVAHVGWLCSLPVCPWHRRHDREHPSVQEPLPAPPPRSSPMRLNRGHHAALGKKPDASAFQLISTFPARRSTGTPDSIATGGFQPRLALSRPSRAYGQHYASRASLRAFALTNRSGISCTGPPRKSADWLWRAARLAFRTVWFSFSVIEPVAP